MPGKVNPTQSEALMMACYQVFGNDVAITASTGLSNFELHVGKPLIAHAHLQSLRLLTDSMRSFELHAVHGLTVNKDHLEQQLNDSLMLVTALVPHIGYDKAARIARHAYAENISLLAAAQMLEAILGLANPQLLYTAKELDPYWKPPIFTIIYLLFKI